MKLGLFSDVHDHVSHLDALLRTFEQDLQLDTLLFMGDFCSPIPARRISAFPGVVHCVFGNGDGDRFTIGRIAQEAASSLRLHGEHAELTLGDRTLALTHYPLYGRALARTGDYHAVFSGHTHQAEQQRFGDCLWLNPGEVLGFKGPPSYAVYDTESHTARIMTLDP